jgi:hypothetical protein
MIFYRLSILAASLGDVGRDRIIANQPNLNRSDHILIEDMKMMKINKQKRVNRC